MPFPKRSVALSVHLAMRPPRRCAVFKHDGDRADCLARQAPQAHTSGTVQGGAVLRDVATPTAAPDLPF